MIQLQRALGSRQIPRSALGMTLKRFVIPNEVRDLGQTEPLLPSLAVSLPESELLRFAGVLDRLHLQRDIFFFKLRFIHGANLRRLVFMLEQMPAFVLA